MSFQEFVQQLQNDEIFPRIKEENINVDDEEYHDIVWEEVDDYINRTSVEECESLLHDYGFGKALTEYDSTYGLDSLKGMEEFRRVKCLLQNVVQDSIMENFVEAYKEWYDSNNDSLSG